MHRNGPLTQVCIGSQYKNKNKTKKKKKEDLQFIVACGSCGCIAAGVNSTWVRLPLESRWRPGRCLWLWLTRVSLVTWPVAGVVDGRRVVQVAVSVLMWPSWLMVWLSPIWGLLVLQTINLAIAVLSAVCILSLVQTHSGTTMDNTVGLHVLAFKSYYILTKFQASFAENLSFTLSLMVFHNSFLGFGQAPTTGQPQCLTCLRTL